jgi:hypothetical protein
MATPTTLPATFTSGQTLTAADQNNLRGAFRILQVVQGTPYSTIVSSSSTTYMDTGLTATITCQNNTSKVLIIVQQTFSKNNGNSSNAVKAQIVSGATPIHVFMGAALYTATAVDNIGVSASAVFLDNPTTTAAITYKTQFANYNNSAQVSAQTNSAVSTITLLEISA